MKIKKEVYYILMILFVLGIIFVLYGLTEYNKTKVKAIEEQWISTGKYQCQKEKFLWIETYSKCHKLSNKDINILNSIPKLNLTGGNKWQNTLN